MNYCSDLTFNLDYAMIALGDSMYNQEIKERFLLEYCNKHRPLTDRKSLLDKVGIYENKVGRDIAQMSHEEVKVAMSTVDVFEYSTAYNLSAIVREYSIWCEKNNIFTDYVGGGKSLTFSDIDPTTQFAKVYFRDEVDFRNSLHKVREFNEGYTEVIILALAWIGLDVKVVLNLREQDVDLINRKIYAPDGTVLIPWFSDDILDILMEFSRCKIGTRENGNTTFQVFKDLSHDVFLKRFCSTDSPKMGTRISLKQARSSVDRVNKQYKELGFPPRFTQINVMRSGGLSRVYQLEQNGVNVFHKDNQEQVVQVYGVGKDYRKIMWQYKFYKKAFNL